MMPHHIRVLEDNLNVLSGTIIRQFALMLELDRKATEIGVLLDSLRGPYLNGTRQHLSSPIEGGAINSPPSTNAKLSPSKKRASGGGTGRRQTRRSHTPTSRTPRNAQVVVVNKDALPIKEEADALDHALNRITELQRLQDRLWMEKILVGKQCLSAIEHASTFVTEASHNISQQLIATSSAGGDYNAACFSTTSAGTHRTSMRTAALIASQAMHQNLVETGGASWRGGDTGGSSVVSRTRKRQSS